jgi:microcystin-dependent protein
MTVTKNEKILASDINGLVFFPVGTILQIHGTVANTSNGCTVNGQTLLGWRICNGDNNTPNLIGRFIRGGTSGGAMGGNSQITLSVNNMPMHTHTLGSITTSEAGQHFHYIHGTDHQATPKTTDYSANENGMYYENYTTTAGAGKHTHTASGTCSSAGGAQPFSIEPLYYELIYIKKVA